MTSPISFLSLETGADEPACAYAAVATAERSKQIAEHLAILFIFPPSLNQRHLPVGRTSKLDHCVVHERNDDAHISAELVASVIAVSIIVLDTREASRIK